MKPIFNLVLVATVLLTSCSDTDGRCYNNQGQEIDCVTRQVILDPGTTQVPGTFTGEIVGRISIGQEIALDRDGNMVPDSSNHSVITRQLCTAFDADGNVQKFAMTKGMANTVNLAVGSTKKHTFLAVSEFTFCVGYTNWTKTRPSVLSGEATFFEVTGFLPE